MSETPSKKTAASDEAGVVVAPEPGPVSQWLNKQGFDHNSLEPDHLGVEQIGVEAVVLPMIAAALKSRSTVCIVLLYGLQASLRLAVRTNLYRSV